MKLLRLAVWNANGLQKHKNEVQAFLQDQNIDIMLISETHFTSKSVFNISNFRIYTTNHPDDKPHGGTAILINSSLKHVELPKYSTAHIQATNISIEEWTGERTISAVYCPPRSANKEEQYAHFFKSLGNNFLAAGDYNAKHTFWGSRLVSTKGRQLLNCLRKNKLKTVSTGEPTYWPSDRNKVPDLVDFCVTKNISDLYIRAESCYDLSSDHSPFLVTLSSMALAEVEEASLTNKQTNWTLYRESINSQCKLNIVLKSKDDIDKAVKSFTQMMCEAAATATPRTSKVRYNKTYLTTHIRTLLQLKRRLRKTYQQSRSPNDKLNLNRATKELKQAIAKDNQRYLEKYLRSLSPNKASDYSLWKATKKINKPTIVNPPLQLSNGDWVRKDQDKVNLFASYLAQVFTPNPPTSNYTCPVTNTTPPIPNKSIKFNTNDAKQIVAKINAKKAPGFDLVTGKMIKELPEIAVIYFAHIANAILKIGYFPDEWKIAKIIMIPKPGKNVHSVESYRPISLLPMLSKVFERMLLAKIDPILKANNAVPLHQFGCRSHHSTIEQVHRVVTEAQSALNQKKYCSAIFLDVAQAFDKVWHEGLLYKIKLHLPPQLCNVLSSYLCNRKFSVKCKSALSSIQSISAGVPQGSVLGSTLYQLFTADIPYTNEVMMATFVDDTAILATHKNPNTASRILQENLDGVHNWLNKWRIKVNESKSAHITFTTNQRFCPTVSLNSVPIPKTETVKYLGIHLDKKLNWRHHITAKHQQLKIKLSQINWLIGLKSNLTLDNKVLIYKSILKPVWTYGIQLWGSAKTTITDPIQRFQSKTLRSLAKAPWYLTNKSIHRDLQVPTITDEIRQFTAGYQRRLLVHPNELASRLLQEPANIRFNQTVSTNLP